jgi:hypothetical protein
MHISVFNRRRLIKLVFIVGLISCVTQTSGYAIQSKESLQEQLQPAIL